MNDRVLIHRLNDSPIELSRDQIWWVDRSRYKLGLTCQRKRELSYHWQGQGVDSAYRSEDLALGSAVHAGLEQMLAWKDGGDEEQFALGGKPLYESCANLARQTMLESAAAGMAYQDDEGFAQTLPEVAQMLAEEQAALVYALVWTFGKRHLASLLERYEVVAVEPEICWLVGWVGDSPIKIKEEHEDFEVPFVDSTAIVMMSRPDAVLRSREDGRLWVVSWKTTKMFSGESVEKLECDLQGLTEAMAVQSAYQEPVGGTFYTYLVKGSKTFSKDDGVKRYGTPLVRPYSLLWTGVGEPRYSVDYERTKGWAKVNIWEQMEMAEWMAILDAWEGSDPLAEAVAEPMPVPLNEKAAQRWLVEAVQNEGDWMKVVSGERVATKNTDSCFVFNKKCFAFDYCHRGVTVEERLASGRWIPRVSNHAIEQGGE